MAQPPVLLTITRQENSPGSYEVHRTDQTNSQGEISPKSRLLLANAIAGLTGKDRKKYERRLERALKPRPAIETTPPCARPLKASLKSNKKKSPIKQRKSPLRKTSAKTRKTQRAERPASPCEAQPTESAQDAPERTKAATCSGNGAGGPAQVQCAEARGEHNGPAAPPGPSREQSRDAGTTPAPAAAVQRAAVGTPRHENAAAGEQQCADVADAEPSTPYDDDGFQRPKRTAGRSPVLHTASP
ncbi:guanine nucleotide-binding protein G(s) subunit alpha isoforms XLas-like, partial [Schistocerca cancellata]|uniref:guanine nucleotide-binding protein G(s) subunit alpha isoforms XLas-like n=1 Tax=Schistocerca cancellata TaxID=274614 RepID=UPI0021172FA1